MFLTLEQKVQKSRVQTKRKSPHLYSLPRQPQTSPSLF